MTRPHTFGPPSISAVDSKKTIRIGCAWCGAPAGEGGITLRAVTITKAKAYERQLLCPGCFQEFEQFGRKLGFREWGKYFWQELARSLGFAFSFRRHAGQVWVQWRFRRRHEQVRAIASEGRLRTWWTDAAGILMAGLAVIVLAVLGWGTIQIITWGVRLWKG